MNFNKWVPTLNLTFFLTVAGFAAYNFPPGIDGQQNTMRTAILDLFVPKDTAVTITAATAAGEILVTGQAGDIFSIKATGDQGASVVTAPGTGIKNTAATNVKGDLIRLVSNGGTNWYMTAQSGIWASQ